MTDLSKLIVGNWKMHGVGAALDELRAVAAASDGIAAELAIAPPFTLIERAAGVARGSRLAIGGQDVHPQPHGAHTGDVCAAMLVDAGASFAIIGHSERRADCGETDAIARAKAGAALAAGLGAIVCVGETAAERDAGRAEAVVGGQLDGSLPETAAALTVAYEPVWAIGTGRTPTVDEVGAMHGFIRARLRARFGDDAAVVRILYGGSVKPDNAAALLGADEVGGALVGGASLTAESFLAIARAADAAVPRTASRST